MVFNAQQLTSFFQNAPQMALTVDQRNRLAQEGLATIDDFVDFKEDQLTDAFKNMRIAIPGVPAVLDDQGNIVTPAVAPIPPCLVSARCALRLKVASIAYHYYVSIGRDPTPSNMNYSQVLRSFYVEWEALDKLTSEDKPDVPVLSKQITPLKWVESFKDCLLRTFGVRSAPLLYVIRDEVQVPAEAEDPLIAGSSFGRSGSVLDELVTRLSHDDPLFKSDNSAVYSMLEEAARGTSYAPTIKPYARTKDGRAAYMSMISSHAGLDKWEKLQKDKTNFLMNTKWNGRTYSLEKFTGLHRASYIQLEEAAQHVNFQLPTEHTRVGYLIDNILNNDPDLRAAISSIRINTNDMRSNFEASVATLLPVCPYSKNRSSNNRNKAIISETTLKGKAQSKTGVDFRWYQKSEYMKLTPEQKKELYEWQKSKDGKKQIGKDKNERDKPSKGSPKSPSRKQLHAQIKALQAQAEANTSPNEPTLEELSAIIAASKVPVPPAEQVLKPSVPSSSSRKKDPNVVAALTLQSILKRKRDQVEE